jgi:hypothetical protein
MAIRSVLGGIILLLASTGFADSVIFDTDFAELPVNWYATTFQFGSEGAYIDLFTFSGFDANLSTGLPVEYIIFVPDGADSVRVKVDYTLHASGLNPSMEFRIKLGSQSVSLQTVWEAILSPANPQVYTSGTLQFSPAWVQAGDFLGVYFRADIIYPGDDGGVIEWYIHNLEITAYGDGLNLEQSTWGSIKNLL